MAPDTIPLAPGAPRCIAKTLNIRGLLRCRSDQIQFPLWGCDSGCRLLLEGMNGRRLLPKLCRIHSAIGAARIVCAYLPNRVRETVQHLRTLTPLTDLRLGTNRNRASGEPSAESPLAEQASRQAKSACAVF